MLDLARSTHIALFPSGPMQNVLRNPRDTDVGDLCPNGPNPCKNGLCEEAGVGVFTPELWPTLEVEGELDGGAMASDIG